MKKIVLLLLFAGTGVFTMAQKEISLYDNAIPNAKAAADEELVEIAKDKRVRVHKVSHPTLTVFQPSKEKANGCAVIICPGGGYSIVAIKHEGYDIAKRLNEAGITAFVLKYRIPDDSTMQQKEIGPLQDAQRALQLVREQAKVWGIDKKRVGIMGFSAGGHLAATAGTHFNKPVITTKKKINLRPDFMVLVYPVISFTDSLAHMGSRNNLLGKNPSPEKIKEYSNEFQVTAQTPPTFLVHANDDGGVKVANSIAFRDALVNHHIATSLYTYDKGGHGFGLTNPTNNVQWIDLALKWLEEQHWGRAKNITTRQKRVLNH